jgi:hypothetical protein
VEDLDGVQEAGKEPAWTRRRLGRRSARCRRGPDGGGGGAASRRAHGVDLAAVGEAVSEVPAWTRGWWMRGGGRGAGICMAMK